MGFAASSSPFFFFFSSFFSPSFFSLSAPSFLASASLLSPSPSFLASPSFFSPAAALAAPAAGGVHLARFSWYSSQRFLYSTAFCSTSRTERPDSRRLRSVQLKRKAHGSAITILSRSL